MSVTNVAKKSAGSDAYDVRPNRSDETTIEPFQFVFIDGTRTVKARLNPFLEPDEDGFVTLGSGVANPDGTYDFVSPSGHDMTPTPKSDPYDVILYGCRNITQREIGRVCGHIDPKRKERGEDKRLLNAATLKIAVNYAILNEEYEGITREMYEAVQAEIETAFSKPKAAPFLEDFLVWLDAQDDTEPDDDDDDDDTDDDDDEATEPDTEPDTKRSANKTK
jgi:hypothetical protein